MELQIKVSMIMCKILKLESPPFHNNLRISGLAKYVDTFHIRY